MANAYGYTPEEMRSTGDKLITVKSEIGEKIATAKSAVDALIGSGFATQAASGAYSEQFLQLSTALGQVNDGMQPLGEFLKTYADQVESTDSQFASALRG